MPNWDNQTILLAIVAIAALAVVTQTIILLAISVTISKTAKALREEVEDLRSAVMPVVYNSRDLFNRIAPQIEATTTDVAQMAHDLRAQTADVQSAAAEVLERLRHQTGRVDAMVTNVLDTADRATSFLQTAIGLPVRQLSGILAAVKAVVESLRNPEPVRRETHPSGENDTFV